HPSLLRAHAPDRQQRRAAGGLERQVPALHQGRRGGVAARHGADRGGRVRPQGDLLRRAPVRRRDRRGLPRRQGRGLMADGPMPVVTRRGRRARAPPQGGAGKVASADFVTAMMAMFMVLWLLTQADMKLRQQIAQYFRDQGVLPGGSIISSETQESKS